MTQEEKTVENAANQVQETKVEVLTNSTPTPELKTESDLQGHLKTIKEQVGQIAELNSEENTLVTHFCDSISAILAPFTKALEISTGALPLPTRNQWQTSKAYLHCGDRLVLIKAAGEPEILNLKEPQNHTLLVEISGEIMLQLKKTIEAQKCEAEKRVQFFMPLTKDLERIAQALKDQ